MTEPITTHRFWTTFERELVAATTGRKDWTRDYESNLAWTAVMMPVLRRIGLELGFDEGLIYKEYFRLDMTWFRYPQRQQLPHLWSLEVAIEHENNPASWYDEWVKLSHIACGLKVLITYHDHRRGKTIEDALTTPLEIYRRQPYKPAVDSWLLIFGPTCQQPELPWYAYTFDGKAIKRLGEMALTTPR